MTEQATHQDTNASPSLDPKTPAEWADIRAQGHQMLDDLFDSLQNIRQRPVWQPAPDEVSAHFAGDIDSGEKSLQTAYQEFQENIQPYTVGNVHPGFMGWVHGGGTVVGMLAEMLTGGLNVNAGGRNQIPVQVERQIVRWVRDMAGFPTSASGVLVTGSSMANFIALLVAKIDHTNRLGKNSRQQGLAGESQLVAYTSASAHGCIAQAMELAGIGSQWLRRIATNAAYEMDVAQLAERIAADRAAGLTPFFIAGTAGTVDTGAIDNLSALADLAAQENLWFHVDGAFGSMAKLSPTLAPRLRGLERADSLALDFHKWGQVPYDAGFALIREESKHLATFAAPAAYLRREESGLAGGSPWPCDFGPDLSRNFRALKVWFTLQTYGSDRLGLVIENTCRLAQYLGAKIEANPALQLMAPVSLNIVCFRHIGAGKMPNEQLDQLNNALLIKLQLSGIAAPSSTTLDGCFVLRAAIVNHRTEQRDIDALFEAVCQLGESITYISSL